MPDSKFYGKYRDVRVQKQNGSEIPPDEPVFVLRAQDILAPLAVRYYADLVAGTTGKFSDASRIRDFADSMIAWPKRKLPD